MIEHYGYSPMHEPKKPVSPQQMQEILARRTGSLGTRSSEGESPSAAASAKPSWTPYAWRHTDGKRFLLLEKGRYGAFRDDATGTRKCLGFADTRDEALKLFEVANVKP